jgi:hypothetical protein
LAPADAIRLAVGEERTVPLAGAGSAGYAWTVRVTGAPGTVEAAVLTPQPPAVPPGTLPFGGSQPHVLALRGLRAGRAEVHLELSRPFGPPRPPRAVLDLAVIVAGGQLD